MEDTTEITFILLKRNVKVHALLCELYRLQSMTNINDKHKFDINYPYVSELIEVLKAAFKEQEEPF